MAAPPSQVLRPYLRGDQAARGIHFESLKQPGGLAVAGQGSQTPPRHERSPAGRNRAAQHGGQHRAAHAKGAASQDREGHAILDAGVPDHPHGNLPGTGAEAEAEVGVRRAGCSRRRQAARRAPLAAKLPHQHKHVGEKHCGDALHPAHAHLHQPPRQEPGRLVERGREEQTLRGELLQRVAGLPERPRGGRRRRQDRLRGRRVRTTPCPPSNACLAAHPPGADGDDQADP